jgi:hypothetical protein
MNSMAHPPRKRLAWLAPMLRRLEHRLGAERDDRTLWIWMVPATTVVVTFVILAFIGMEGKVDLALTIPMALVLSLFLGSLSAFYLTAASSDERDADNDDGGRRPVPVAPSSPPPQAARRVDVGPPRPSSPEGSVDEKTPVGVGADR